MTRRKLGLLLITAVAAWPLAASGAPGDPDRSFSRDGRVRTPVANKYDTAQAVARQSSGKILAAGWGEYSSAKGLDFVLIRYTRQGKLDKRFGGGDGIARLHAGGDDIEEWNTLHVLPNDKILAVGISSANFDDHDLVLARYKPNGRLDRSFSGDGKVVRSMGADYHQFNDLVVFPSGDIGVVGSFATGSAWDLLAMRFRSDGKFLGQRVNDIAGGQDTFRAAVVQGDKLVAAGLSNGDFIVMRYRNDGIPDATFGQNMGYSLIDFGAFDQAQDLVRLPTGEFILVGETGDLSSDDVGIARVDAEGILDTPWNGDGKVVQDFGSRAAWARSVELQPRGRFAVSGAMHDAANHADFLTLRYEPDGSLDPTFGDGGVKTLDLGKDLDRAYASLVQPDGRLVLAGESGGTGAAGYHFAAARLKGDVDTDLKIVAGERLIARGYQFPAVPGEEMIVTLYKKKGGTYREVARKTPKLKGRVDVNGDRFRESRFRASFERPASGSCRIRARWPGGRGYPSSKKVLDGPC